MSNFGIKDKQSCIHELCVDILHVSLQIYAFFVVFQIYIQSHKSGIRCASLSIYKAEMEQEL